MSTADDLRDMSAHLRAHPEANLRDEFDTLLWLLIEAFSKSADDLAEAGRNDTTVVRDGGDGAGKGSTARSLPPLAGADASDVSVAGQDANEPHRGAQSLAGLRERIRSVAATIAAVTVGPLSSEPTPSLGDALREYRASIEGGYHCALPDALARLSLLATKADELAAERDRLAAWKAEAMVVLAAYDDLAKRVVPEPTLGRSWVDLLAEHVDALTAERDRLAADIAIMRDAGMTATDVQRRRAETAEAAVARVRALVHDTSARVGALMFTPMTRARQYVTGVTLDDLRAALDEEGV